jgi:manganese/iron transport system substrate-binding protein
MKKLYGFLLLISCFLVACENSQNVTSSSTTTVTSTASPASNYTPQTSLLVVTTVAPITNIVSNIAGERVKVQGIVPEGTDSHTFEPRPSDAEILAKANLIIVNGLSLETPTQKLANSSKPKETQIYQIGDATITQKDWIFDSSFPKEKGDPNPHLWVNTRYAVSYAKLAAQRLIELDPQGKDYYNTNLKNYLARLDELDKVTRAVVASIPPQNRKLLTYHDSWAYWAKDYGFSVIGAIQPSDFNEPSAKDIAKLLDQINQSKVPAIFGSEVYPSKIAEQIAREAKVKLANTSDDSLPGEGSANAMENTNPQHTYVGMMADNLKILAENLGGDPKLLAQLNTANVVGPTAVSNK